MSVCARYLAVHLSHVNEVSKLYSRSNEYFEVLSEFSSHNSACRMLLIRLGSIALLTRAYLGFDPLAKVRAKVSVTHQAALWTNALKTLSMLVRSCSTPCASSLPSILVDEMSLHSSVPALSELDARVLECRDLYIQACTSVYSDDADQVAPIAAHLAFNNLAFSSSLIDVIVVGLGKAELSSCKTFWALAQALVPLNDDHVEARFIQLFREKDGLLHILNHHRHTSLKFTYTSLKRLVRLLNSVDKLSAFLLPRHSEWQWVDVWLKEYIHRKVYASTHLQTTEREAKRTAIFEMLKHVVEQSGATLHSHDSDSPDAKCTCLSLNSTTSSMASSSSGSTTAPPPYTEHGPHPPSSSGFSLHTSAKLGDLSSLTSTTLATRNSTYGSMSSDQYMDEEMSMSNGPEWACSACTLQNKSGSLSCSLCDTPRPTIINVASLPVHSQPALAPPTTPQQHHPTLHTPASSSSSSSSNSTPPTHTASSVPSTSHVSPPPPPASPTTAAAAAAVAITASDEDRSGSVSLIYNDIPNKLTIVPTPLVHITTDRYADDDDDDDDNDDEVGE